MVLNYIGSKRTLLPFIGNVIDNLGGPPPKSFCDPFSGTCSVGNYFKNDFAITSNDAEYYSYIISYAYLNCSYTKCLEDHLKTLNNLKGRVGLVTKNYSECRLFFTNHNAQKIDAMRTYLDSIRDQISRGEYIYLLACILEASDKVANIACVYGAFLKKFKKSAKNEIQVGPIHRETLKGGHDVHNLDVMELFKKGKKYDIVYLDPPYNHRQYSSNYFVLNYIAKYKDLSIRGKTGILTDCFKSKFSSKRWAKQEFEKLVETIRADYIVLSYNNEGIIPSKEIIEILSKKGRVTTHTKQYKKFKAQMGVKERWVTEYLYVLKMKHKVKEMSPTHPDPSESLS